VKRSPGRVAQPLARARQEQPTTILIEDQAKVCCGTGDRLCLPCFCQCGNFAAELPAGEMRM